jgi:hypothetical protein
MKTVQYQYMYSVSILTCTAACGSTEADNAVLDDDPTRRDVLETAAAVPLAGPRAVSALNDMAVLLFSCLLEALK